MSAIPYVITKKTIGNREQLPIYNKYQYVTGNDEIRMMRYPSNYWGNVRFLCKNGMTTDKYETALLITKMINDGVCDECMLRILRAEY